MKTTLSIIALAAASLTATAHAGFTGWQAIVRGSAGATIIDVFAGFDAAGDRLLNIADIDISLSGGASFVQAPGADASQWRPVDGTSNSGLADSFVTLGGFVGADGHMYSSFGTTAGFANYATSGATTISDQASWSNVYPASADVLAVPHPTVTDWASRLSPAGARGSLGVWVGHFLVNRAVRDFSWSLTFGGSATFNDGASASDLRVFHVPAPGAIALLGVAGLARGRRRR